MADCLSLLFPPPPREGNADFPPGYPIRIESAFPERRAEVRGFFGAFEADTPTPPKTVYRIRGMMPPGRGFGIWAGEAHLSDHANFQRTLWELDWRIMHEVVFSPNPYYLIHGGLVTREGCAVLLGGAKRAGKSALALGMVLCGWQYLSDDITAFCPDSLLAVPFPRNFSVRRDILELLRGDGETGDWPWVRPPKPLDRYMSPNRIWEGSLGNPARATHIFFSKYAEGAVPSIVPMSRAAALHRIGCRSWGAEFFGRRTVDILAGIVDGTECFELTSGPLFETCRLVERICGFG